MRLQVAVGSPPQERHEEFEEFLQYILIDMNKSHDGAKFPLGLLLVGFDLVAELHSQLHPELVLKVAVHNPPQNLVAAEADVAGLFNNAVVLQQLQSQDAREVIDPQLMH